MLARRFITFAALAAALGVAAYSGQIASAQSPGGAPSSPSAPNPSASPAPPAAPAAPQPATPPAPAAEAPSQPPADTPPSGAPATGAPATGQARLPTLLPGPSDSGNIDEVVLPSKPAAILTGTSSWDEGFKTLSEGFNKVTDALLKAGIKPAGRPIAIFIETDDMGFHYEAMVPIEKAPDDKSGLTSDIRFGTTPAGKAIRFTHKAPYDEIDNTYEAITAYLDAKGISVKDAFIEEYASDLKDAADENLEINIYVQPK